ncbi:MAG: N-acetylneuraminate synthase family protein [Patescibacteria group bacterium]|nr:N-acetylneuraminate synthase family protein [Patescibacteria group bacterium]
MFLIAEIGVNWDGDFGLLEKMMNESKIVGFNAVKLQAFNESMISDHPQLPRLIKTAVTAQNVKTINDLANSIGIEWFCTPMYPEAVDFLDQYVSRFKIREFDGRPLIENKTTDLIERVLKTQKEVIISSSVTPRQTKYYENSKIKWLYCVPKYPCHLEDLDFTSLQDFHGYSNHHPHFLAPLTASILGGKIIEIHVTINKTGNYFDNNVSFDFNEASELIKLIHQSSKIKTKSNS